MSVLGANLPGMPVCQDLAYFAACLFPITSEFADYLGIQAILRCLAKSANTMRSPLLYLFSFAVQFRTMDIGVVSACLSCVRIKKRWPSRVTS